MTVGSVAACLHLLIFGCAAAQSRSDAAELARERQCEAAAASVTRSSGSDAVNAVDVLGRCATSGPGALARFWRTRPSDPDLALHVRARSRGLRDVRLLDAVLETAKDNSAPVRWRMAALDVLAAYVDDSLTGLVETPGATEDEHYLARFYLQSSPHAGSQPGAQPFPPGHVKRIMDELGTIEATATDEKVQIAAKYLLFILPHRRQSPR